MRATRGFTLLELLVAMAIFALIGVGAYTGLFAVLDAREATRAQSQRLAAVQYAVDTLVDDLRQAVDRPVRAARPAQRAPLHAPGARMDPLLAVTRGGLPNPADLPRSTLGRVEWRYRDDGLERGMRARPDAVFTGEPVRRRVLERVDSVSLRFRDAQGEWSPRWPPLNATGDTGDTGLPRAVEITLELADWGELVRLVALPAGSGVGQSGAGGEGAR